MNTSTKTLRNIIIGIVAALVLGTTTFALTRTKADVQANCRYGQCQAIAKSTGQQCKHCVSNPGDAFCWEHK